MVEAMAPANGSQPIIHATKHRTKYRFCMAVRIAEMATGSIVLYLSRMQGKIAVYHSTNHHEKIPPHY